MVLIICFSHVCSQLLSPAIKLKAVEKSESYRYINKNGIFSDNTVTSI